MFTATFFSILQDLAGAFKCLRDSTTSDNFQDFDDDSPGCFQDWDPEQHVFGDEPTGRRTLRGQAEQDVKSSGKERRSTWLSGFVFRDVPNTRTFSSTKSDGMKMPGIAK
ncbi:hypothetical protein B9Z55_010596 [Caenorhabditis nigoni]|uniref:Uncharacterized protein n=1 Tax=Caenorhabditis nigoni TaxID=1611254 RepID=A0A2G5UGJ4_9PELO|nr:hypothetical protein B9Z55_010596 [Caenorhabditis nigoni]